MRSTRQNAYYVQGNTVRKVQPVREAPERQKRKVNHSVRKNRERAKHMSPGYVLFLSAALLAVCVTLMYYIGLQSDITNSVKNIAALERQLNTIKVANEEDYSRISSSVDLEEIRRIAIQELGMQYAQEGQIISFASENSDYVKQMAEIPKKD
ncbi:MAG: cell division protein FtsL [Bacteroidales bacterium]|nr:cell division protein FtsL [Bacteroidales bacterium]MCM1416899.1 cell division protein FtsL [bacterium]MCM1424907.1 cell division protein FtsL [bacterium]